MTNRYARSRFRSGHRLRRSLILVSLALVVGLLFSGCGDPQILIQDRRVYDKPVKPFVPMNYLIMPGDELEILFYIDPGRRVGEYKIDSEDVLRIQFYYYPTMDTTATVRPDGRITVPLLGDIAAADKKPTDLAAELSKGYAPHLSRPNVTVQVLTFNAKVNAVREAITTAPRGQSRLVHVQPDGNIALPIIRDVKAMGLTSAQLSEVIQNKYREEIDNIDVTASVLDALSNKAYIFGMVNKPGFFQLVGPTTLTQIIAMAEGLTDDANSHEIVLISRRPEDGRPEAKVVDLNDIVGQGNAGFDEFLKQFDVVYVPRTRLSQAAIIAGRLWRFIPDQFYIGYNYSLGGIAVEAR